MAWPYGPDETTSATGENEAQETTQRTLWTVSTYYKKSIEEVETFTKDDMEIIHHTVWRWGSWSVYTNDGNPPEFEFDGNMLNLNYYGNNIEEIEMNETSDGVAEEIDWPEELSDEEQEELEALIEEDGYYSALEDAGWSHYDTDMYVWGPILIEGENEYRRIIIADDEGNISDFTEE
ncbi:MAG: hypothetical protein RLZZ428_436 [Pseudomonadota bacterium]